MTDLPKIRYITPEYVKAVKDYEPPSITRGRPTDMYWIIKHMQLPGDASILEFGAWPCDNWRAAYGRWKCLLVTDSFMWSNERGLSIIPLRAEWEATLDDAGVQNGRLDVQDMDMCQAFDGIFSVSVLEHVIDDDLGLKNIFNALVPGGLFVFTVEMNPYIGMKYSEDIWFRVYKQADLVSKLCAAGFEVNGEAEPYEDFDTEFKHAIEKPSNLRYPYRHFRSAGVVARKPN